MSHLKQANKQEEHDISTFRQEFHLHQYEMVVDFNNQILYVKRWLRDFFRKVFGANIHQGVNLCALNIDTLTNLFDEINSLRKDLVNSNSDLYLNHLIQIANQYYSLEIRVNCFRVYSDSKYICVQLVNWNRTVAKNVNDKSLLYQNLFQNVINSDNKITFLVLDRFYNIKEFNAYASNFYKWFFDISLYPGLNFFNLLDSSCDVKCKEIKKYLRSNGKVDFILSKGKTDSNSRYKFTIDTSSELPLGRIILIKGEDITKEIEQRKNTRYLNTVIKNLESELDTFIYSLSHGLMSPIATLQGLINLIEVIGACPEDTFEYFEHIKSSSIKMEQLVTRMKEYYLNRRKVIEPEVLKLEDIIKGVVENYSKDIVRNRIEVSYDFKVLNDFHQDCERVKILIDIIINNSIRFMDTNKKGKIKFKVLVNDSQMYLEIVDNGMGIDDIHIDKVFDLFYKANIEKSNTGVGLFLAKQITKTLNGTIEIKSKLGYGSTVSIILPNLPNEF